MKKTLLIMLAGAIIMLTQTARSAFADQSVCSDEDLQRGEKYLFGEANNGRLTEDQLRECIQLSKSAKKTSENKVDREENGWLIKVEPNKLETVKTKLREKSLNPTLITANWLHVKGASENELKSIDGVQLIEPNYRYTISKKPIKPTPTPTSLPTPTRTITPTYTPTPTAALTPTPSTSASNPNDPYYNQQWSVPWIQTPDAWRVTANTSTITIAVIDTGCGGTAPHPDLTVAEGYNTITDTANFADDNGHGTHVAGTIGALTNNGIGITGLNWQTRLVCIKALNYDGSGYVSDLAEAITWATNHGTKIINASWGGNSFSQVIADAVTSFQANGGLFVAARGNTHSNDSSYPALLSNVIAVGATDQNDRLASFSSWGQTTLVAPGVNIMSLIMSNVSVPSYAALSGTSMATPHVTAIAALVWTQHPSFTPLEVKEQLQQNADDLGDVGYDAFFGYGRINAARALGLIGKPVISKTNVHPLIFPNTGGTVTVEYHILNANTASLKIADTTYALDVSKNSQSFTIPSNSTSANQNTPMTLTATGNAGSRTITLPSVQTIAAVNKGTMTYLGKITTNLQQSNDVAYTNWTNNLPMVANADYYLGTIGITFQLENGNWGPQVYRRTYVSGGAQNGTVAVQLQDVSGDAIPDLIGFSRFNGIFIWKGHWPLNEQGAVFSEQPDIIISNTAPDDGTVADLDNDGLKDIVWVQRNMLITVTNKGNMVFEIPKQYQISSFVPNKVEVVQSNGEARIVVHDWYYYQVRIFNASGEQKKLIPITDCRSSDMSARGGSPFTISIPCGPLTGITYITVQPDNNYTVQRYNGTANENWRYTREILVAGAPNVFSSEYQYGKLVQVPIQNPSLMQQITSDVLPGRLEQADINGDGLDDLIGGLDGSVSPSGSPIRLWRQNP